MPHNDRIVKQVKDKLMALADLCDSGYLLAVHIRYTRPTLMYTTYPSIWLEHYGEKGMMMVDPVVLWAMSETTEAGVAHWTDLAGNDPAGVIAGSAAHGLHNGMSFAVGPITSRTIGSVTKSTAFTAQETALAEMLVTAIHNLTNGLEKMDQATQDVLRGLS